jgi:type VI secretion system protein VasG
MSQQATEITVSHVLIQMLAIPRSDLRVITQKAEIGTEELGQALTVEHYATMRHADSYPVFSPLLVEWLRDGWLLASADAADRTARRHLLLALLHSAHRYVPPAAARLLTGSTVTSCSRILPTGRESAESVMQTGETVPAVIQRTACFPASPKT